MVRIRRIKRIAIAVKDLDAAVENWKRMFGIKPFMRGEEPEDKYAYVAFYLGNTKGDGEMTIEFLSPINDPNGEMLIGKFIRERGEGLYMITLEPEGSAEEVVQEMKDAGLEPAWGGYQKKWVVDQSDKELRFLGLKSWCENYVHPKDANGVLVTLASIDYADPPLINAKVGITVEK